MEDVADAGVEDATVVGEVRAALGLGVLVDVALEDVGAGGVEDHDAEAVGGVVHRGGGDGAVERL